MMNDDDDLISITEDDARAPCPPPPHHHRNAMYWNVMGCITQILVCILAKFKPIVSLCLRAKNCVNQVSTPRGS